MHRQNVNITSVQPLSIDRNPASGYTQGRISVENLISREEILKLTRIGHSQFKGFRRYGLIDGYVKRTSIVKLDEKKTKEKGKEIFSPAGFTYFYPRKVLSQISWIVEQRRQGKNLSEIQTELIRKKIREDEELRRRARKYERTLTVPADSTGENGLKKKLVQHAVAELAERVTKDNPDRNIKTLIFVVEAAKNQKHVNFHTTLTVRLDVENSLF